MRAISEVVVLALFTRAEGHHAIPSIFERQLILFSDVHVDLLGKSCPILIGFLNLLSALDDVDLLAFVFIGSPGLYVWEVFRFHCSVGVNAINADEFSGVFVELFDVFGCGVHGGFDRPIDMHNSAESAELYQHLGQVGIWLNVDD